MNKDEANKICRGYISVKHEIGTWQIMNKVLTEKKSEESWNKVAKELRKDVSENQNQQFFKSHENIPSRKFAWAVFQSVNSTIPMIHSDNWINNGV